MLANQIFLSVSHMTVISFLFSSFSSINPIQLAKKASYQGVMIIKIAFVLTCVRLTLAKNKNLVEICPTKVMLRIVLKLSLQVRHGAASGLREIIKIHGSGGGKHKNMEAEQVCLITFHIVASMKYFVNEHFSLPCIAIF